MATTPDMIRVLATHQQSFGPDEPLLSAVAAELPKGDSALSPEVMAAASNFPLARKVTVGITAHRLAVYKSGWGNKIGAPLGMVDLSRIANVEIAWNRKLAILAFDLADAPPVVMRAVDASAAEHFRIEFLRLRGRL